MTKENETHNSQSSPWWLPNRTEFIMLSIAVLTLIVSILAQAKGLLKSIAELRSIYEDLYPFLNAAHLLVILYIAFAIRNIHQQLPEMGTEAANEDYEKRAEKLVRNLKTWLKNSAGEFYYKGEDETEFVKKQITAANKNTKQLYSYWHKIFAWLFVLYVVEFIKSLTPAGMVKETNLLLSLVIIFNNVATVYWFFIYLTLNLSDEPQNKADTGKIARTISRWAYWLDYVSTLSFAFGKKYNDAKSKKSVSGWKMFAWILFGAFLAAFIYFMINKITRDDLAYKTAMYLSVLLGACSMLAAFSRLGSGALRIPLSALLVMLFYSAVQPLFFAEEDFKQNSFPNSFQAGQLLFIINLICLIGKFALLYVIKWIFSNYRMAYYFINEQITRNKALTDDDLEALFSEAKADPA